MLQPKIILIAAMDCNNAIGKDGTLPWKLPADMARFKMLTMGKTVLMGRETYQSIGRALPGRRNLVLTTNPKWSAPNVEIYRTFESAVDSCEGEVWVIGGGKVYAYALPFADRLELTHVDIVIEGADTWFPKRDKKMFGLVEFYTPEIQSDLKFAYSTYHKIIC